MALAVKLQECMCNPSTMLFQYKTQDPLSSLTLLRNSTTDYFRGFLQQLWMVHQKVWIKNLWINSGIFTRQTSPNFPAVSRLDFGSKRIQYSHFSILPLRLGIKGFTFIIFNQILTKCYCLSTNLKGWKIYENLMDLVIWVQDFWVWRSQFC